MNKLMKGLALAFGIAVAGMAGCNPEKPKPVDFGTFLNSLKARTEANYNFRKNSTPENSKEYNKRAQENDSLRNQLGIHDLQSYLKEHGVIFFENHSSNSIYLGKIEEPRDFNGTKVYLTAPIIGTYEHVSEGISNNLVFRDTDGKAAINLEFPWTKDYCKDIATYSDELGKNNERLKKNDSKWNPRLQALYTTFKDTPKSTLEHDCVESEITDGERHEYQHVLDGVLNDSQKYSLKDLEKRAILKELMSGPGVLWSLEEIKHNNNGKGNWVKYENTAEEIFKGLYDIYGVKTPQEFYSKVSVDQMKKGARILWEREYKD